MIGEKAFNWGEVPRFRARVYDLIDSPEECVSWW